MRAHRDRRLLGQHRQHGADDGAHLGVAVARAERWEMSPPGSPAAAARSLRPTPRPVLPRRRTPRRTAPRAPSPHAASLPLAGRRLQQARRRGLRARPPRAPRRVRVGGEHGLGRLRPAAPLPAGRNPRRTARTEPAQFATAGPSSTPAPRPCFRRSRSRPAPPAPWRAPRCRPAPRPRRAAAPGRAPPCRPSASCRRAPTCS